MFEVSTVVKEAQLLYPTNMVILNFRLIKRYSAEGALLLSMLLSMESEAAFTKKLLRDDDGTKYFQINKKYITEKTGISNADQNLLLSELKKSGVLKFKGDKYDIVHIEIMEIINLLTEEKEDFDIKTKASIAKEKENKEMRKQQSKVTNLLKKSVFTNPSVLEALRGWLSMMIVERHENLNEESLRVAEGLLIDFCGEDDSKMIKIINETTSNRWRSFDYVIRNMRHPSPNYSNNRNKKYEDPTVDAALLSSKPAELSNVRY